MAYICEIMFKVFEMRKSSVLFLLLFAAGVVMSSCRAQKQACAAYGKADTVKTEQSNS